MEYDDEPWWMRHGKGYSGHRKKTLSKPMVVTEPSGSTVHYKPPDSPAANNPFFKPTDMPRNIPTRTDVNNPLLDPRDPNHPLYPNISPMPVVKDIWKRSLEGEEYDVSGWQNVTDPLTGDVYSRSGRHVNMDPWDAPAGAMDPAARAWVNYRKDTFEGPDNPFSRWMLPFWAWGMEDPWARSVGVPRL